MKESQRHKIRRTKIEKVLKKLLFLSFPILLALFFGIWEVNDYLKISEKAKEETLSELLQEYPRRLNLVSPQEFEKLYQEKLKIQEYQSKFATTD